MFIRIEGLWNITVAHTSPVGSSCFLSNEAGSDEMPPSTCSEGGKAEEDSGLWQWPEGGKQVGRRSPLADAFPALHVAVDECGG